MNVTNTIEQFNQGWNATSEAYILPIYEGGQLINGVAYTACHIRRTANHIGEFVNHVSGNIKQQDLRDHIAAHPVAATMIGITALALGDKIFG